MLLTQPVALDEAFEAIVGTYGDGSAPCLEAAAGRRRMEVRLALSFGSEAELLSWVGSAVAARAAAAPLPFGAFTGGAAGMAPSGDASRSEAGSGDGVASRDAPAADRQAAEAEAPSAAPSGDGDGVARPAAAGACWASPWEIGARSRACWSASWSCRRLVRVW